MIRKLRLKFVAICMAMVTAVLAVVCCALYVTFQHNIENLSRQVLYRAAQESSFVFGSGDIRRPEMKDTRSSVLLPYFTVEIWNDRAYVTGGTYANLEDTDALQQVLSDCLAQSEREGILRTHSMRYLRQDNGLYQKIAFVDMSMEMSMLRNMMGPYVIIVAGALLLLLLVSVLLSFWATRPVEKAWDQQRRFLSDASHELKTPLTVILSNAALLDGAVSEDRPARWLDNIQSEAAQMKTLVEEMLTLARADNTESDPALTEQSLSDIAADCVLSFEPVAFETGKALSYQLAENVLVLGNPDKLHRLISVLLDNAIKYGAEGGTVSLTLEKTDRQARLTVSNPGEPIPPEQLERLFERFFRADQSRGEKSGFGLGLSIARTIAAEHKATLRAESDAVSTRFLFTIPLKK